MEAIVVAVIAAVPLTITAWNSVKNRKDMAVTNGHKPGFMIEETYGYVLNLDRKLDTHVADQAAHCQEAHTHHEKDGNNG
jgi:hypothetical protein